MISEVNGSDIGHVQDAFHFHRVRWNIRLVYGFDDSEVTLVTYSFSLLSKPILDLFQIQWAFHWMNLNWIGSHSYLRSHIVVDHLCSHSKASDRAGNDGRSGHDLDLHGHERDAKRVFNHPVASFPDQSILWLYLMGSYKPVYSPHCHLHFLSHPDTTYPIELNRVSLLINSRDTNPCCSPTIFRINREREERVVDPSLFSSPLEW